VEFKQIIGFTVAPQRLPLPLENWARMRLDAIAIGVNPPDDINVVVEVPVGGEPIKYELDKAAGHPRGGSLSPHDDAVPRELWVCAAYPVTGW
jgi:hypothetical protein